MGTNAIEPRLVVTSATSLVGQDLLRAVGGAAIALVRKPSTLTATRVILDWTTNPEAADAIRAADAVVHLSGEIAARSLAGYRAANVDTTRRVAENLRAGQRVVFVSYLHADPKSSNLFLRTKGEAEEILRGTASDVFIFRTQIIAHRPDAPGPFEDVIRQKTPGERVRLIGNGRSLVRPIAQVDVVDAVLAAVAGRGRPGTYDLVGPDALSLNEVVRLYNRDDRVPIAHTPGWLARLLSWFLPDLPPTLVDLYLRDVSPGDPAVAQREFGLTLSPLKAVWGVG